MATRKPLELNYKPANAASIVSKYREIKPVHQASSLEEQTTLPGTLEATTGLSKYTGEWTSKHLIHLLNRTLFGIRNKDLAYFSGLSLDQTIEEVIKLSPIPSPPVNNYSDGSAELQDPDVNPGDPWVTAPRLPRLEGPRIVSLKSWLVKNMLNQEATIHQKMMFFWHNLIPTKVWEVFLSKTSYQYFDLLYRDSLGNYKKLIRDITLAPSMLVFLNGTYNNKNAPDENYARELQELFCIGKGPDANFTEGDVQAAARVLTGWVVNGEQLDQHGPVESYFYEVNHDTSDKQFSEFYENKVIEGKSGPEGASELDELLDMIFAHEETARYITRRLYTFFVNPVISEFAETNIIRPLANDLRELDYEIVPVLKILLSSEHFFDPEHIGAMIKSPLDHLIGLWRTLEIDSVDENNLLLEADQFRNMFWRMAKQSMELGDPPTVSGWPAYYQTPVFDKAWITTLTITERARLTDGLIYYGFWLRPGVKIDPIDLVAYVEKISKPEDPEILVREASLLIHGLPLNDDSITGMKETLLGGQPDYYWTQAWNSYQEDPSATNRSIIENRLKPTFQLMFQMGEAHLM